MELHVIGDQESRLGSTQTSVQELESKHDYILKMIVGDADTPPMTQTQVANRLGVHPSTISHICKSPLVKQRLREMRFALSRSEAVVKEYLLSNALHAASRTVELVDSESEPISLAASKDVLDRAGVTKEVNIRIRGEILTANYSDAELARLVAKRLNEMNSVAIEVEAEVVDE